MIPLCERLRRKDIACMKSECTALPADSKLFETQVRLQSSGGAERRGFAIQASKQKGYKPFYAIYKGIPAKYLTFGNMLKERGNACEATRYAAHIKKEQKLQGEVDREGKRKLNEKDHEAKLAARKTSREKAEAKKQQFKCRRELQKAEKSAKASSERIALEREAVSSLARVQNELTQLLYG
eukprot:IDg3685t1